MHVSQESIFSYTLYIIIKHENTLSEENSNARNKKCNDYGITCMCSIEMNWIEDTSLSCTCNEFSFNVAET